MVTAEEDAVEFAMNYYYDDTADVKIDDAQAGVEEYQLDLDVKDDIVGIEVYQDGVLVDEFEGDCDEYEGQAAILAVAAGMTLADWLISAAVTVIVSKTVYDAITSGNVTRGKSKAPSTGAAGSIYEQVDNKGNVMSRTKYGKNKKPEWRQDYTHTHYSKRYKQNLQPHQHNYTYNSKGQPTGDDVSKIIYY